MMINAPFEGASNRATTRSTRGFGRPSTGQSEAEARQLEDETELQTAALTRSSSTAAPTGKEAPDAKQGPDVLHLSGSQKADLVNKLFETEDLEAREMLKKLNQRTKAAEVETPTVTVRWNDLKVTAAVGVGSNSLPTVTSSYKNTVLELLAALHIRKVQRSELTILDNIKGVLPPERICLLLGPPGSGKSTLLEALAGKLGKGSEKHCTGELQFNGAPYTEFVPERTSAYITQIDEHMAELTVRETVDFSRRVQGAGDYGEVLASLDEAEKARGIKPDPSLDAYMKANTLEGKRVNIKTELILHAMGLNVCADTQVGSAMIRGISGGQKKRVTTAEMIVGPKKTLFMDEISTGLDSSTTFQIVRNLRDFAHLLGGTVLIALLQPAPEVYDLFDDVLLLSEGHVLFHGPCKDVMPFFQSIGFDIPERKGIPDFLQEVSGRKDQKQYWTRDDKYRFVPVTEIAGAFQESKWGKDQAAAVAQPYERTELSDRALIKTQFALSKQQQFNACFTREWTLIKRTSFLYIFKTAQVVIMALIAATLWLRTQTHPRQVGDATKYSGFLLFTIIILIFNGIAEMSICIERLPIFAKQRDNHFYGALAFVLPTTLLRIPYSAVEAIVWAGLTYYEINLDPAASRFFMFLVLCMLVHQWSVSFFRMIGALFRNLTIANAVGLMVMLVFLLTGGYVIDKHSIHHWVVWLYWVSPIQYAQRCLMVNEFTSTRWQRLTYSDAGPYAGETLGNGFLQQWGFPHEYKWCWISLCYLLFCVFAFNLAIIWCHVALGTPSGGMVTKSPEQLADHEEALYGDKAANSRHTVVDMKSASSMGAGKQGNANGISRNGASGQAAGEEGKEGKEGKEEGQGMMLPFEPCTLTFSELHYMVPLPAQQSSSPNAIDGPNGRELELLKGISGAFRPKTLTALMGVTGAGKTTLMDCLAGRKTGGRITGDVRLNGHVKVQATFARVSGYVEQTDIHDPYTTVYEALIFAAKLRVNNPPSSSAVDSFVEQVEALVELGPLHDSLVGKPGVNGLSVEQRKRLTIAVELVANPSVIFMDEPTSGLDARAAAIVMRCVKSIVETGRTIVCTIHQPSIDIFEAFDELVLLKRGGQLIFCGPIGDKSADLIGYFQAVKGVNPVEEGINPATWALEQTSVGQENRIGVDFAEIYANSQFSKDYQAVIDKFATPAEGTQPLSFPAPYAASTIGQYKTLTWRYFTSYWRLTEYNAVRFLLTVLAAAFFGFVFWALGGRVTTQEGITAVAGALYASTIFMGIINSISIQPTVAGIRGVMYREKAAGTYSIGPWVSGLITVEMFYGTIQAALFSLILYFAAGFDRNAGKFFWFLLFCWFTLVLFTFFGVASVAVTPNVKVASVLSSNFYSLVNVFAGFIIARPAVPGWWVWMSWLCPTTYTLEGLVTSQVGNFQNRLETSQGVITTPRQYIKEVFGYRSSFLGQSVAILTSWLMTLIVMAYLAFKYINHLQR